MINHFPNDPEGIGFVRGFPPLIILMLLCLVFPGTLHAQSRTGKETALLERGIDLYGMGDWYNAVTELRRFITDSPNPDLRAEALYWIILAEIGAGEYEASLNDIDEMEWLYPDSPWRYEIPYYKGRVYYNMGRYDEGLIILKSFADSIYPETLYQVAKKYASLYWAGECLYSLGQLDKARDMFSLILEEYPQSVKYEAAVYRVALINQKKIEMELLALLKWSHEESLKTVEEYQRRERSYEQAIIAYQKRIAELLNQAPAGTDSAEPANQSSPETGSADKPGM